MISDHELGMFIAREHPHTMAHDVAVELREARKVIACIPATKDGVPAYKRMAVYLPPKHYGKVVELVVDAFSIYARHVGSEISGAPLNVCYSTRELAEADGKVQS